MPTRPRRSVLFMPGSNLRAMDKARTLACDTVIFDLEDAVSAEQKNLAREQVVAAIAAGGYGAREIIVRANGLDTEWIEDDIQALATSGADGICLPKIENDTEVESIIRALNAAGAPKTMQLWVMIETPLGVLNVDQIASADPRLSVLVIGTTDLAKELHLPDSPERVGLQHSLSRCLLAARANHREILDGVYLDVHNQAGFAAVCEQGRQLGFDGKTLIHPSQLAVANNVFGPSAEDLQRAEKIIQAWADIQAQGRAVVLVDGKLIEEMHVAEARRHLAIAAKISELANA